MNSNLEAVWGERKRSPREWELGRVNLAANLLVVELIPLSHERTENTCTAGKTFSCNGSSHSSHASRCINYCAKERAAIILEILTACYLDLCQHSSYHGKLHSWFSLSNLLGCVTWPCNSRGQFTIRIGFTPWPS